MKKIKAFDDIKATRAIDAQDMLRLLVDLPDQCARAKEIGENAPVKPSIFSGCRNILFTGLGGSAIGADILRSYLSEELEVPLIVNRNYTLPAFVSRSTLVIVSSYSGNTEETVAAYKEARSRGARIIAVTSGGEIGTLAASDGAGLVTIPGGLPPRCALGYSFFTNLAVLSKIGAVRSKSDEMDRTIALMRKMEGRSIGPGVGEGRNPVKRLASQLRGRYAIVYGASDRTDCVATRWRGQIAENAKALASSHVFPEMNHNEIVGWQYPAPLVRSFVAVFLRDAHDHPRVSKRIDITEKMIRRAGAKTVEVFSEGVSLLERLFSLIYTGDFLSYYLALLYRVDPTPVDRIAYLKKELERL